MEGAVGERLRTEFNIYPDKLVTLASHVYGEETRRALKNIYSQYAEIGVKLQQEYNLKILGGCCGTDHIYMEEVAKSLK